MKQEFLAENELKELTQIMNIKYGAHLKERDFKLSQTKDKENLNVKVILEKEDESFYYPVEAQINFIEEELSQKEAALFLFDYIDYYFDEYFKEDETIYLNIDWKKVQFDSKSFQIKGQILNLKQEKAAENFLNNNLQKV